MFTTPNVYTLCMRVKASGRKETPASPIHASIRQDALRALRRHEAPRLRVEKKSFLRALSAREPHDPALPVDGDHVAGTDALGGAAGRDDSGNAELAREDRAVGEHAAHVGHERSGSE